MSINPLQLHEIEALNYNRPLSDKNIDIRVQGLLDSLPHMEYKRILEIGCLDGFHTVQLARHCVNVTATDIRPSNINKALYRCLHEGIDNVNFKLLDMELMHQVVKKDEYEVIFHSGCFYHLADPITHLANISQLSPFLLLETHIANPEKYAPIVERDTEWGRYLGTEYPETGWADSQSSKDNRKSFWLTESSLESLFSNLGLRIYKTIYKNLKNPHGDRNCYLLWRRPCEV